MWQILTTQIREEINDLLVRHGLFPEEQKGWHRGARTGDLLYTDQHILKESKTSRKMWPRRGSITKRSIIWSHKPTLYMVWKCTKYQSKFITEAIKNWKIKLTTERKILAEVKIQKRVFHGDALLPLLSVIAMMLLNWVFRRCKGDKNLQNHKKFTKSQIKMNHLMYMDDIKLFAKTEKE